VFQLEGHSCRVIDISAGGASFEAPPGLSAGDIIKVKFKLPYLEVGLEAEIKILDVHQGRARSRFLDLDENSQDKIHLYVLENQKIRARRKTEPKRKTTKP
ncbi:MAG: PilZ domain-containing protein, partial [Deltaproteobacteria bacterium]|nr:PilZ domain-containing protein [Deltaproteobacteria bacterium]